MMLTRSHLAQLCELSKSAALMAGEFIQSQFEVNVVKERKVGGDSLASQVVTEVDIKAQEIILNHLQESIQTYDLGLLTEEAVDDQSRLQKDYFWCIDPLDGTMAFTEHRTGYAVSIALISKAGDPVIGVVYIPDLKECYYAYTSSGVFLNNQPFVRNSAQNKTIHWYMDQSFLSFPSYERVKKQFEEWVLTSDYTEIEYHSDFGAVRNAIGIITSPSACYFKFPKKTNGAGSIWDYASTRLFMKELGLWISNAHGHTLHLNNPITTFMNHQGILYATDQNMAEFVIELGEELDSQD